MLKDLDRTYVGQYFGNVRAGSETRPVSDEGPDNDGAQGVASSSPEAAATKNLTPDAKNTGANIYADANVLESSGKEDETDVGQTRGLPPGGVISPTGGPGTEAQGDTAQAPPGDQSMAQFDHGSVPDINMLNVYKQWAIGGTDAILQAGWAEGHRFEYGMLPEPYVSPFSPPTDVNEQTARLMGSFQLPALISAAGEVDLSSVTGATQSASELPGQRIAVNESMSPSANAYQAQITGKPGQAYILNGVRFDGMSNGVLLEAKGPRYANFVQNGKFQGWFRGERELVDQADRQMRAAKGAPIQWHVAEEEAVQTLQNLFNDEGITGIKIIYTPASQ